MPVIRIGDDTWEQLKRWAVPLEDKPDDALRKVLQVAEDHRHCLSQVKSPVSAEKGNGVKKKGGRLSHGGRVPQEAYENPILGSLIDMGGSATIDEVLQHVEDKMRPLLGPVDYETVPSGKDIRWRNTAAWARHELVKQGLLRDDSERGTWELTTEGKKAAQVARTQNTMVG